MRLLILTQKVDVNDSVLGFFHSWLLELSKKFEKITVICLFEGKHSLPQNIKILSLGKEGGESRVKYIFRFFKYIFSENRNYTTVLVHMNPIYLLLGGIFWKISGKRVFLWYNHIKGSLVALVGAFFAEKIFFTSSNSFFSKSENAIKMPAGIDDTLETKNNSKISQSVVYIGRLSPVKKVEIFIEALLKLQSNKENFKAAVYGDPGKYDIEYAEKIKKLSGPLIKAGLLEWFPGITFSKIGEIFSTYEWSVNMTNDGSFDKTILESMISRTPTVISNKSFKGEVDERLFFTQNDSQSLAGVLTSVLNLSEEERKKIIEKSFLYVKNNHSLSLLADKLVNELG